MPVTFQDDVEEARGGIREEADAAEVRMDLHMEADALAAELKEAVKPSSSAGEKKAAKKEKAGTGVERNRRWLKIAPGGEDFVVGSSTLKLAHKLGVQPRDLRFVRDPMQSCNSIWSQPQSV